MTDEENRKLHDLEIAAYERNGVDLCRLEYAERLAEQVKAAALVAANLEYSAGCMARRSHYAKADGDPAGAIREWCIAAREYDWASALWSAIGFADRAAKCRSLADAVRAGEQPPEIINARTKDHP
jgi:hypothetical protein